MNLQIKKKVQRLPVAEKQEQHALHQLLKHDPETSINNIFFTVNVVNPINTRYCTRNKVYELFTTIRLY